MTKIKEIKWGDKGYKDKIVKVKPKEDIICRKCEQKIYLHYIIWVMSDGKTKDYKCLRCALEDYKEDDYIYIKINDINKIKNDYEKELVIEAI